MSNIYLRCDATGSNKAAKIRVDDTKHYPNKNEATLLRKLKKETGLSEEEIRKVKKYNKMLSEAQNTGEVGKLNKIEKYFRNLIKSATKQTGLAKEHPETIKVLDELLNKSLRWNKPRFLFQNINKFSAKKIIERYGK